MGLIFCCAQPNDGDFWLGSHTVFGSGLSVACICTGVDSSRYLVLGLGEKQLNSGCFFLLAWNETSGKIGGELVIGLIF